MKSSKTKITMLLTVLFMCVMLVPAVKAEAYGIRQITAGTNDASIVWDADTDSHLQGWIVYLNGQQIATLNPNETSFQFAGLTQGYPYAAQVYSVYKYDYTETPSYYKEGETVLKTKPTKIEKTDIIWDRYNYIKLLAQDPNLYTDAAGVGLYADGFEIVIKDKKGKTKQTFDTYNSSYYGGAYEYFKAPSALVNKGMQYSIRAYITLDNGEKVYGDAVTKVAVPQAYIDKIQKVSGNKCKITWKKISGASGYTIYRTSNEGKTLKKIKTVGKNTTSYTVKRSYMDTNKKGIVVIANKVKIGKKKYNSTKSYYTYIY